MMKYNNILLILVFVILSSCERNRLEDKIDGVWIYDYELSTSHDLYNRDKYFDNQSTIIIDFNKNGEILVKNLHYKDSTAYLKWSSYDNLSLVIDSTEYFINGPKGDSLCFIEINNNDSIWQIFKRPLETHIELNEDEISNILTSNIWTTRDTSKLWARHLMYFNDGYFIFRVNRFDRNLEDTTDNLQLENWTITKYGNYYFIHGMSDMMLGNGNWDYINQIASINSISFSFLDYNNERVEEIKLIVKPPIDDLNIKIKNLEGKWISKNSDNRTYGKYLPVGYLKTGRAELYKGELIFEIDSTNLTYKLDNVKSTVCEWKLGKDAKTLVLEHKVSDEYRNGIYYEYINVLDLTDSTLRIRLFDYNKYTELEKPRQYYLNLIQEFKKSKKN